MVHKHIRRREFETDRCDNQAPSSPAAAHHRYHPNADVEDRGWLFYSTEGQLLSMEIPSWLSESPAHRQPHSSCKDHSTWLEDG
jgi:hypothetical protein